MSGFTSLITKLDPQRDPAPELLKRLGQVLRGRMRKTGYWSSDPKSLGYDQGRSWHDKELFNELLLDAYWICILKRYSELMQLVEAGNDINGCVYNNVARFLTTRFRAANKQDVRIHANCEAACVAMIEAGELDGYHIDQRSNGRIRLNAGSVLSFAPGVTASTITPAAIGEILGSTQLLFGVPADDLTVSKLDEQKLPGSIKDKFRNAGIRGDACPNVQTVVPGSGWQLSDKNNEFLARHEAGWINVFDNSWSARAGKLVSHGRQARQLIEAAVMRLAQAGVLAFRFGDFRNAVKQEWDVARTKEMLGEWPSGFQQFADNQPSEPDGYTWDGWQLDLIWSSIPVHKSIAASGYQRKVRDGMHFVEAIQRDAFIKGREIPGPSELAKTYGSPKSTWGDYVNRVQAIRQEVVLPELER